MSASVAIATLEDDAGNQLRVVVLSSGKCTVTVDGEVVETHVNLDAAIADSGYSKLVRYDGLSQ